jgi:tetratricopeptide (TPR) repeat protein
VQRFDVHKQGKLEEAIAELRAGILIKPNDADARINLGITLVIQGKPEDAVCECRAAIRMKPDDAEGHYGLDNMLRDGPGMTA